MRRRVVLTGATGLLGRHVLARRLLDSEAEVSCLEDGALDLESEERLVRSVLELMPAGQDERAVRSRLHRVGPSFLKEGRADEIFDAGAGQALLASARELRRAASTTRALLDAIPSLGATELNYAGTLCVAGSRTGAFPEAPVEPSPPDQPAPPIQDRFAEAHRLLEREVVERCQRHGVGFRVFRLPLLLGEPRGDGARSREGFQGLLWVLAELVREVQDRMPEYFEYCALRCLAPPGSGLHLLRAADAAQVIDLIARRPSSAMGFHHVVDPERVQAAELLGELGKAHGIGLLGVPDRAALNPVDRLFHARLGALRGCLASRWIPGCERALTSAGLAAVPAMGAAERLDLFRAHRRAQAAELGERRARASAVLGALEQKTAATSDGAALTYYAGGKGAVPIVILNALGQGLQYWLPLVHELLPRRRVILWAPRGTHEGQGPLRLDDQVGDLEAVLREEDARSCHLCAWCTGPKVAVQFQARRPELVTSMVFLMGAFKPFEGRQDLNTEYERTLEPICQILARRPEAAASVISSLQASVATQAPDGWEAMEPEPLGNAVLGMMSRDLATCVMAPFRDGATVVRYAHQLLDFWSHQVERRAPEVKAPVLFVGAERDRIASPRMSQEVARRFPAGRCVQLLGATHYAFHDRPALVAELMETFFEEPELLREVPDEAVLER